LGGAAAGKVGPRAAGAAEGLLTSAIQDLLNGRPIDWQQAGQSAAAGQYGAAIGAEAGKSWSDGLPPAAKGQLGESLGEARSTLNGLRRDWVGKTKDPLPNRSGWIPDGRHGRIKFEDKFGYDASLSPNQVLAQAHLGNDFVLYHSTPDDIGRLFAIPGSAIGTQIPASDQRTATYPEVWDRSRPSISIRRD
jgi:hypothetical protein